MVFVHTREPPHAHPGRKSRSRKSFDRLNVSPSSVVARPPLRPLPYLPIVFNFDKPETKVFTETVRLLAGLSHFVIADVTNPKSAPLELQATVPEMMVPFLPIIEEGQEPFAMLTDLWIKHRDWMFQPLHYSSLDALVGALDKEIIRPAEARFDELIVRKAETMKGTHV